MLPVVRDELTQNNDAESGSEWSLSSESDIHDVSARDYEPNQQAKFPGVNIVPTSSYQRRGRGRSRGLATTPVRGRGRGRMPTPVTGRGSGRA